jgi:hypothetical protein
MEIVAKGWSLKLGPGRLVALRPQIITAFVANISMADNKKIEYYPTKKSHKIDISAAKPTIWRNH